MGFLIDSSVLIAAERGRIAFEAMLTGDLEQQPFAIAAITASELLHGVYRAGDAGRAQKRQRFVDYLLSLLPGRGAHPRQALGRSGDAGNDDRRT